MSQAKLIDRQDISMVQCNYCQEPFAQDEDLDWNDQPSTFVDIPVECDEGNFCGEECRAQAMYEAQTPKFRETLRKIYLGATLLNDNRAHAMAIMDAWDMDYNSDDTESILQALSPDGGIRGKEGVEDDCEALLVSKEASKVLWNGLYMGRRLAIGNVVHAQQNVESYPNDEYWAKGLAEANLLLADAEAALKALEALRPIV
jgi:hypothetical protein